MRKILTALVLVMLISAVRLPVKAAPLFDAHRFKSVRGGRDGAKSWTVSTILLEQASERKLLTVCARENMNSIADSCHRLIANRISDLGMQDRYAVEQARIYERYTKSEFVFKGLRHNPDAIKSLEGANRLWVEEAQSVSKDSWDKAIPTIRRPGSEVWLTWNPQHETDDTWQRFVVNPPPDLLEVIMNFSDNPWASQALVDEREALRERDADEYAHIWLGQPRRQTAGSIYAAELRLIEEQGRIGNFPYNPAIPVDTGWDLGDSDLCCIWFLQRSMGQYRVIDYEEDNHKPLSHYLSILEGKGYKYGKDYFPWDASSKMLIGSLEETMRARGRNVVVMPRQPRAAGIDAAREMLGTAWFNLATCEDGINRLRYYRQAPTKIIDPVTGQPSMSMQPVHDQNSHGADAFRTIAMGYRRPLPKVAPKPQGPPVRLSAWS